MTEPFASDLEGRVAVVTGAAGGIGHELVRHLGERGARTAGLDLEPSTGSELSVACDVTEEAAVRDAFKRVEAELGPVELLVCAAGVVSEHPVAELSLAEWRRVIDASLTGTFLTCRAAIEPMRGLGRGRIVAFSSGFATKGCARGAHYAAAKAGVEGFVKSLALEAAPDGITVNAVAPGPVATPMIAHHEAKPGWREALEQAVPLGRVATPADVVGTVLFLLGDGAAYVTGQIVHVNGGFLMP